MGALEEVKNEMNNILTARKILGLDETEHPVELWLALSHVESAGQAIQDTDGYVGKLQIGDAYYQDAYEWLEKHHPSVIVGWPIPKRGARLSLRGDDERPYIVAMAYMERYAKYHDHQPRRMAHMHKSGIGGAKQVKRKIKAGFSENDAFRWVSRHWKYTKGERAGRVIIPRAYLYVTGRDLRTGKHIEYRFDQAFRDYTEWTEQQFGDHCTCTCGVGA